MDEFDRTTAPDLQPETRAIAGAAASAGTPPFRAEAYWQYLETMDLTEPQKVCLLHTLWTIMAGFVDLGFGVDPVQHILPALLHATLESGEDTVEQEQAKPQFAAAAGDRREKGSTHDNNT